MAKIIGEAGIRLRADSRGLAVEMRAIIQTALREATAGVGAGSTKGVEDDANRTATRVRGILSGILGQARNVGSGLNKALAEGQRLALLGAAAGVGLAGISSLVTGVVGLIGVLGQAAGAAGLIPAALLAVQAASVTVKLGMDGLSESFKALASGDMTAFRESLKDLAPNARAFVTEVAKIKPAFDELKLGIQNRLFAGLGEAVRPLAERYLPIARDLFGTLAVHINSAAKEAITFAKNGEVVGQVGLFVDNVKESFRNLIPAVQPALSGFLDFVQVGSDFLPGIAADLTSVAQGFGEFMRNAAGSGQLAAFFQNAIDTIKQLGGIIFEIGQGLAGVFRAAEAAGGGFLQGLNQIVTAFSDFTNSVQGQQVLVTFFSSMREIIAQVIPVVLNVVSIIASTLVPIFTQMAQILLPAVNTVVTQFGAALKQAQPGIIALTEGIATMLEVFGPTITLVVQLAGILGGVLGKVLETLAPALARITTAFVNGLIKIMPQLEPMILAVADAVVMLIDAALPLIPIFLQLLTAVLPILPPLIQLVAAVLPPLISLVQSLMPIIQAFADILVALIPPITSVVTTILNILIPPIQFIAAVVSEVAQIVAQVFTAMSGTVTGILNALGAIISGIWQTIVGVFTTAVQTIGNFVRGGFDAIKSTISGIIGGIRDAVGNGIDAVVGFFRELPGKVLGFLGEIPGKAFEAGKNIIQGIVDGLASLGNAILEKLKQMVSAAWDAVVDFFSIFSPSRLAIKTFEQVGRGAAIGIENMIPRVTDAASEMAKEAMAAMNDPLALGVTLGPPGLDTAASVAAGGLGSGITLNQTNVMQPGTDVRQFAAEVNRHGAQLLASGVSALPVSTGPVQIGMAGPSSLFGVSGVSA